MPEVETRAGLTGHWRVNDFPLNFDFQPIISNQMPNVDNGHRHWYIQCTYRFSSKYHTNQVTLHTRRNPKKKKKKKKNMILSKF